MKNAPAMLFSGLTAALAILMLALAAHAQADAAAPKGANATPQGFTLGAAFRQGYDSNIILSAKPEGDTDSALSVNLAGQWSGPRWNFGVLYTPQAVTYARHTNLSYISQGYEQTLTYLASPQTQVAWSVNAAMYPQRGGVPGAGFGGVSGAGLAGEGLGAASDLTTGSTNFSVERQTSLRSSWMANVQAGWTAFSLDRQLLAALGTNSAAGPGEVAHSVTFGGSAGWSYRLSPQRSLTLSAGDSVIRYTRSGPKIQYSTATVQLSQQVGASWTLRAGGGPSWTQNQNAIALPGRQGWGYNASAGLVKQFGRSESGVQWQHTLQASYVPGGLSSDLVALQYRTQWAQNWSSSVEAGYSRQFSPELDNGAARGTAFVSGTVGWQMAPEWWLQAEGGFYAQPLSYLGQGPGTMRRVNAAVGIEFRPREGQ